MTAPTRDIELTPAAVAQRMGWSRDKAWRKLRALEREHPGIVQRRGREMFVLGSALAKHLPGFVAPDPLARELEHLRTTLADIQMRIDATVKAAAEHRRQIEASILELQRAVKKPR